MRLVKLSFKVYFAFFESNILTKYNNSISDYLTSHKHAIYHLYQIAYPCCSCDGATELPSTRHLNKDQFDKLFSTNGRVNPNHIKEKNGIVIQHCICNVTVNPLSCLQDLDFALLYPLIQNLETSLQSDDEASMRVIKDVSNRFDNVDRTTEIQILLISHGFTMLWMKLESAVLSLASKVPWKYYKYSIQDEISSLKQAEMKSVNECFQVCRILQFLIC